MASVVKPERRTYRSPGRSAAAEATRIAILRAAKASFEERGWPGTTMRAVAERAGVSVASIEAIFGTKSVLLKASVDFAISGDVDSTPIVARPAVARMEAVATADEMLMLHAAHLRAINSRSAHLAGAVEQAAGHDGSVGRLWSEMNANRAFAVRWATDTLLSKPDHRTDLTRRDAESVFWVALDWATYRTLTSVAGLSTDQYEEWLRWYYRSTLLDPTPG